MVRIIVRPATPPGVGIDKREGRGHFEYLACDKRNAVTGTESLAWRSQDSDRTMPWRHTSAENREQDQKAIRGLPRPEDCMCHYADCSVDSFTTSVYCCANPCSSLARGLKRDWVQISTQLANSRHQRIKHWSYLLTFALESHVIRCASDSSKCLDNNIAVRVSEELRVGGGNCLNAKSPNEVRKRKRGCHSVIGRGRMSKSQRLFKLAGSLR